MLTKIKKSWSSGESVEQEIDVPTGINIVWWVRNAALHPSKETESIWTDQNGNALQFDEKDIHLDGRCVIGDFYPRLGWHCSVYIHC